jgi:hypothetical protein
VMAERAERRGRSLRRAWLDRGSVQSPPRATSDMATAQAVRISQSGEAVYVRARPGRAQRMARSVRRVEGSRTGSWGLTVDLALSWAAASGPVRSGSAFDAQRVGRKMRVGNGWDGGVGGIRLPVGWASQGWWSEGRRML